MALTAADFIHPLGRLRPDMFPGESLIDLVDTWFSAARKRMIVLGIPGASSDTISKNYVYHRAYSSRADVMSMIGQEYEEEEASIKFTAAQLAQPGLEADRYLQAYLNGLASLDPPIIDPEFTPKSVTPGIPWSF